MSIELRALERENEQLRRLVGLVIEEYERAVAAYEAKVKGSQQVTYHGPFANITPAVCAHLRRAAREMREALDDEWPWPREVTP